MGNLGFRHQSSKIIRSEQRRRKEARDVVLNADNICDAINRHRGVINEIAFEFGITRSHIDKFIVSCPRAVETLRDAREALGDLAEQRLYDLIEAGDRQSIIYYLGTKCRNRGYFVPRAGEDSESAAKQVHVHTINIIGVNGDTYQKPRAMLEATPATPPAEVQPELPFTEVRQTNGECHADVDQPAEDLDIFS